MCHILQVEACCTVHTIVDLRSVLSWLYAEMSLFIAYAVVGIDDKVHASL